MAEEHPGDHHPLIRGSTQVSARGILRRFAHLLSAEGVDGVMGVLFFLYLAWLDTTLYGEVMYALAAGGIAAKVIQFGLYYPLVTRLARASKEDVPELIGRVVRLRLILLFPTLTAVWGIAVYRGFSTRTAAILLLICLGFALEALADTFFADLRVRGKQRAEAGIKVSGSILSYGYGFLSAFAGLPPVAVGMFKMLSGIARLVLGVRASRRGLSDGNLLGRPWTGLRGMIRAASIFALIEILGVTYNKTNIFFLERFVGIDGVALYSATWNIVDPVSTLASEQFLGWVIFPLLASLWVTNQQEAARLVRSAGRWLFAIAMPIMFFLYVESDTLIGLLYRDEYRSASWMQHYLVWTILLSFENNLFAYVMMVHGAARMLLAFSAGTALLNLLFNLSLVQPLGLAGGCLVIVLTKLAMTTMTFSYCQMRFRFFQAIDFAFPMALGATCLLLFHLLKTTWTLHPSAAFSVVLYILLLGTVGRRFMTGGAGERVPGRDPGPP